MASQNTKGIEVLPNGVKTILVRGKDGSDYISLSEAAKRWNLDGGDLHKLNAGKRLVLKYEDGGKPSFTVTLKDMHGVANPPAARPPRGMVRKDVMDTSTMATPKSSEPASYRDWKIGKTVDGFYVAKKGEQTIPGVTNVEKLKSAIDTKEGGMATSKSFNIQTNIGSSKYVVNHYDGVKKHKDGSEAYDIATFSNKVKLAAFVKDLRSRGYSDEDHARYIGGGMATPKNSKPDNRNLTNNLMNEVIIYGGFPMTRANVYRDALAQTNDKKAADTFAFGPNARKAPEGVVGFSPERYKAITDGKQELTGTEAKNVWLMYYKTGAITKAKYEDLTKGGDTGMSSVIDNPMETDYLKARRIWNGIKAADPEHFQEARSRQLQQSGVGNFTNATDLQTDFDKLPRDLQQKLAQRVGDISERRAKKWLADHGMETPVMATPKEGLLGRPSSDDFSGSYLRVGGKWYDENGLRVSDEVVEKKTREAEQWADDKLLPYMKNYPGDKLSMAYLAQKLKANPSKMAMALKHLIESGDIADLGAGKYTATSGGEGDMATPSNKGNTPTVADTQTAKTSWDGMTPERRRDFYILGCNPGKYFEKDLGMYHGKFADLPKNVQDDLAQSVLWKRTGGSHVKVMAGLSVTMKSPKGRIHRGFNPKPGKAIHGTSMKSLAMSKPKAPRSSSSAGSGGQMAMSSLITRRQGQIFHSRERGSSVNMLSRRNPRKRCRR